MRELSVLSQIARHSLTNAEGWYRFFRVPLSTGRELRLVDNREPVDANPGLAGEALLRWQPCSVSLEMAEESSDGRIDGMRVSVPNVSRLPIAYVEGEGEIVGANVEVYFQHESAFAAFDQSLVFPSEVLEADFTEMVATFICSHPSDARRGPAGRYNRVDFPQLLSPGSGGSA